MYTVKRSSAYQKKTLQCTRLSPQGWNERKNELHMTAGGVLFCLMQRRQVLERVVSKSQRNGAYYLSIRYLCGFYITLAVYYACRQELASTVAIFLFSLSKMPCNGWKSKDDIHMLSPFVPAICTVCKLLN